MANSIEGTTAAHTDTPDVLQLDGSYTRVETINQQKTKHFRSKFGSVALEKLEVRLTREYEHAAPRTTQYEALAAYRTDSDSPDQTRYPAVLYSNALLTTPRTPGTATNRYFLNPVYEGFSSVNVSAKRRVAKNCVDKLKFLLPHTIPLTEMADDEFMVATHVSGNLGLGQSPDARGITHYNKNAYSRGVQISLVQAARLSLYGAAIDTLHGRGPGPINKTPFWTAVKSVGRELGKEAKVAGNQLVHDPLHALHNYPNIITHRPDELASYIGDAKSLLQGDVARAMPHISPDLRGYVMTYTHDPFGVHKDYVAHFDEFMEEAQQHTHRSSIAPGLLLIRREGAHLSGTDRAEIEFDRLEWQAERNYLDGKSQTSHVAG